MNPLRLERAVAVDRRQFLLEQTRDRVVLHLGCVDNPFLEERLASGELLHLHLDRVAKRLYGVDLDGSGLARLRAAGFERLYQGNVEQLEKLGERFDIVVAGELVEHLANPGSFLRAVGRQLADDGRIIITVPSAQSIRVFANALRMREMVHPEHNAYYSPSTLRHLLESHDFEIEQLRPYWSEPRKSPLLMSLYDRAIRATGMLSPWLGEGLVAVARYRNAGRGKQMSPSHAARPAPHVEKKADDKPAERAKPAKH